MKLDGSQHINQKFQDEIREASLMGKGYPVIRIIAREVAEMPVEVNNRIKVMLEGE